VNIGERTPVRRRLESIVPPVWNICDANASMFATIAQFKKEGQLVSGLTTVHVERLVETEESDSRSVPIQSGGW
jgi:hypothetical protein